MQCSKILHTTQRKILHRSNTFQRPGPILHSMKTRPHTRETLAANIKALLNIWKWDQKKLAEKAGVSQKTISNMVNPDSGINPQLDNVEKVATAFGLSAWHLIIPNLPEELLRNGSLEHLAELYIRLPEDAREVINRVAERECAYSKTC